MNEEKIAAVQAPYFTVVVTAYNLENHIGDCISSVQNQSFTDFECILVDDGSADKTAEVIRSRIRNDLRFRIVTIPHGGPQRAKNAGLMQARGKFILFADGDDTLDAACLADCREKTDGSDLLIFGIRYQKYADGKLVSESAASLAETEFSSASEFADRYMENPCLLLYSNANKFYRTEALKNGNIRFRDELSFGEDRVFNFDFLRICKKIRLLPGVYYNYRAINPTSLTQSFRPHHIDELLYLHEQKIRCLCALSQKASAQEKEKYAKSDYDGCFCLARKLLENSRSILSDAEYAAETAYLEDRFVPFVPSGPHRFFLEQAWRSRERRIADFAAQIRAFKDSDALRSLMEILSEAAQKTKTLKSRAECADDYAFLCQFGTRKGERYQSRSSSEELRIEELLSDKKVPLYQAFYDLGMIGGNKTCFDRYDYILILGGANNANRARTIRAKQVVDALIAEQNRPKLIAALSTNRKIGEAEHTVTDAYAYGLEYEYDILTRCMENELFSASQPIKQRVCMEYQDADPTFSAKVVEFCEKYNGCTVRAYCAPKRNPNVQRADTNDCLEFFLQNCDVAEDSNVLLVTNNIYCATALKPEIGIEHKINLDVVGCTADDSLITPERMSCSQHINELIKMFGEFKKFEEKYL